jgi:hypothetical protein
MAISATAICVGAFVPASQAAAPAWKLLALTGPTYLPPRQSEVQRLTVEAEGGSFTLGREGEGEITPVVATGSLTLTEGSAVATIESVESGAAFGIGDRITVPAAYDPAETTVVACAPDCETPGATITLSNPALATETDAPVEIFTKQATVVAGDFHVGDRIAGAIYPYYAPGTVVSSVAAGMVTFSNATTFEYLPEFESTISATITSTSPPVPYNASAEELQTALEGAIGTSSVHVVGGPGGTAEHPYFVEFTGALASQNVPELLVDWGDLAGPNHFAKVFTIVPGGAGTGMITINPANVGGSVTSGEYVVEVGPLPEGVVTQAEPQGQHWLCSAGVGVREVKCSSETPVGPLTSGDNIVLPIEVHSAVPFSASVPVTIVGGEAGSETVQMPLTVSLQHAKNGVAALWAGSFDANGNLEAQAGGHPYSAVTYFMLNTVRAPNGKIITVGDPKNVVVDLPPGFSGNPLATPRCPQAQLQEGPACTGASLVGRFNPVLYEFGKSEGTLNRFFYNDVPPKGYAAEFTTKIAFPVQSLLASVRSSEDYGIRVTAPNNPNYGQIYGAFAALQGFPEGSMGKAFLSNGTSCAENAREAPTVRMKLATWQNPDVFSLTADQVLPAVTNCGALQFHPSFSLQPTVTSGSSGTGVAVDLHIPQEGLSDASKLATPNLKKTVVHLPAGLSLNASSANGLESCSESQIGFLGDNFPLPNPLRFNEEHPTCPDGSKLGTVEVDSPLVENPLKGTVYLAAQDENPFHSLLAIYVVIDDARTGIVAKLPGELQANGDTGQLTATFDYNPQLTFEDLKLVFRGGGPRSELATPEVCGQYKTTGSLEPWSAPESGPPAQIEEGGFNVSSNCASSASTRPFSPGFEAGTTGTQAGSYAPLVIKVTRKDGEQELKRLNFTLPKGLTGKLAGIPYCPESAIEDAEKRSGKAEQASPSCPANSQIGTVDTSAGVGAEPFHVGGNVYLSGPYEHAPLSSVVITPAVAGPFDLGNVVVRAPLFVDPETAQITAKSDPIPTILKGIPLKVRSVSISVDRSGFTLNPTNCDPTSVTASIAGSSGATANPSNRFQVGGCNKLKFKPKLQLSLKGETKRIGHPALKAVLTYPKQGAYANIARAQVNLPHSEFLDQGNLNKTCTKPVLLEGKCTAKSIYGKAKAWTPLLDKPLEGPVYLVGGYGYKLPALVAELNGQIRVVLKGKVDSGPNKGIRNTFEAVPDAPVSRFVLEMKGGKKYGLLENSENLCQKPQRAIARFTAQNGLVDQSKPLIANQCGKKSSKPKGGKGKK